MAIEVIGAGFGRTGTTSLARALELLGYGRCYHMQVAMTRPAHPRFWIRARAGAPVDFRRLFRGYRAVVDWPACEFYARLLDEFPGARVVLTLRDPAAWYESTRETLWSIDQQWPRWFPQSVRRMHDDVIWNGRFGGRFADREHAIAVYEAHLAEVRRTVPPGRLLEFDVREGWAPLCAFLDRPVPVGQPFPRLNDRRWFSRVLIALRFAAWLGPIVMAVIVAGAVLAVCF